MLFLHRNRLHSIRFDSTRSASIRICFRSPTALASSLPFLLDQRGNNPRATDSCRPSSRKAAIFAGLTVRLLEASAESRIAKPHKLVLFLAAFKISCRMKGSYLSYHHATVALTI